MKLKSLSFYVYITLRKIGGRGVVLSSYWLVKLIAIIDQYIEVKFNYCSFKNLKTIINKDRLRAVL